VVVDYERYCDLTAPDATQGHDSWIEEAFGVMESAQADEMLQDIQSAPINQEITL